MGAPSPIRLYRDRRCPDRLFRMLLFRMLLFRMLLFRMLLFRMLLFRMLLFRMLLFRMLLFRMLLFRMLLFRMLLFRMLLFRMLLFRMLLFRMLLFPRPPVQARSVTETLPIAGQVESLPAPVARPSTQLSTNTGVQRYGILLGSKSRLRGALIDGVVSGSAADVAGIKPADRVVSVDGLLTHDDRALVRQLANLPQQTVASLGVVRGDTYLIKSMMLTTEIKSGGPGQQPNASTKRQSTDEENMETETGVLEGIGSVLGDLFGGAGKKDGKAQVEMVPQKRKEDLKSSEPVRQTSFEQKVSGQLKKMVGDPPSLNGLPVKPKSKTTGQRN